MANAPIPGLPVAITLDGSEQIEIVQPAGADGTTKRATAAQIANTGTAFVSSAAVIVTPSAGGLSGGAAVASNPSLTFTPVNLNGKNTAAITDTFVINNSSGNLAAVLTAPRQLSYVSALTTLNLPSLTADFIPIQRGSDGVVYKINISSFGLAAGNVPAGGDANQVLTKNTSANFDTIWADAGSVTMRALSIFGNSSSGGAAGTSFLIGNNFSFSGTSFIFNGLTGDVISTSNSTATIINTAAVTYAKFQQITALSVHANNSSVAAISTAVAGTANQVLIINPAGTGLLFGQVNLSATAAITGFLATSYVTGVFSTSVFTGFWPVPFGGTGQTSLASGGVILGNGTSAVSVATGSANQVFVIAPNGTTVGFGQVNLTAGVSGVLPVSNGGIGTSTLSVNGVLIGNGTSAVLSAAAAVTSGWLLTSNGTATPPSFQAPPAGGAGTVTSVATGTGLSGGTISTAGTLFLTVPVVASLGGTGTTNLLANGILVGNSTGAVNYVTAGVAGQILIAQTSTSDPLFQTVTGDLKLTLSGIATITTNAVDYSKIQQMTALSVHANSSSAVANSTAVPGTASQVLVVNDAGTGLIFGRVNLSTAAAVTGNLIVLLGGSGTSGFNPNGVVLGGTTSTAALRSVVNGTTGFILTSTGTATAPTWQAAGASSGGLTLIGTASPTGTATAFTSIAATYAYLVLQINNISCDTASRSPKIIVSTNNGVSYDVTSTAYLSTQIDASAVPNYNGTANLIGFFSAQAAADIANATINIYSYQGGTNMLFNYVSRNSAGQVYVGSGSYVNGTSAINAIQVRWDGSGSFDGNSNVVLYGAS